MDEKKGPGSSGTHAAYYPEYQNEDKVWKPIPITETECGIRLWPYRDAGEIIGLMSYEAAMAIAYMWKASDLKRSFKDIRLAEYQLDYSIDSEFKGHVDIPRRIMPNNE